MNPDISEFSYGYALTENLIAAAPKRIRAAPIFPSLIEEGKKGGGYDVHLPFPGFPLFLQFKLSHHMVRDSAFEAQAGLIRTPFYRMHLRPTKHSQQHPMLLALERKGAAVYYAAPRFHKPAELNDAYIKRQVVDRSVFIKPSEIGRLPDDDNHHVSFRTGYPMYLCSQDPHQLRETGNERGTFLDDLAEGYWRYERLDPTGDGLHVWNERLLKIIKDHRTGIEWVTDHDINALRNRPPLNQFAYLSRTFFGCNVVVVAPDDDDGEV